MVAPPLHEFTETLPMILRSCCCDRVMGLLVSVQSESFFTEKRRSWYLRDESSDAHGSSGGAIDMAISHYPTRLPTLQVQVRPGPARPFATLDLDS